MSKCSKCGESVDSSDRDGRDDDAVICRDCEREQQRRMRTSVTSEISTRGTVGSDDESDAEETEDIVVVDELLTYCAFYRDNSSSRAIQEAVVSFFHADEISISKKIMWNHCGPHLGAHVQHKKSSNRDAHVADVEDIVKAFSKLDREGIPVPKFVAVKLDRIPRFGPEEIDLTSLVMRVNELERQMATVNSKVAKNKDTVETLLDVQCQTSGYAAVTKRSVQNNGAQGHPGASSGAQRHPRPPLTTEPGRDRGGKAHAAPDRNQSQPREPTPGSALVFNKGTGNKPPVSAPNAASAPANAAEGNTDTNSGGDFTYQREQRRKLSRQNRPNRNNVVFGKATASDRQFTGAARTREIFVFNIIPETSDTVFKSFFEELNVPVHELECMSNAEARTKSYRVKVSMSDIEKVMDPEIWPESVGLRLFYRKRKVNTNAVNTSTN